jgi:hypothetical protein
MPPKTCCPNSTKQPTYLVKSFWATLVFVIVVVKRTCGQCPPPFARTCVLVYINPFMNPFISNKDLAIAVQVSCVSPSDLATLYIFDCFTARKYTCHIVIAICPSFVLYVERGI